MGLFIILVLFIALPVLGYYLFTGVFDLFFPQETDSYSPEKKPFIYIDRSNHHYDNRQIHLDGDIHTINGKEPSINN